MADEKLGLTTWGTQFVLGSLRELIDEGVETPGLGEVIKSRKAAMLRAIIEITKLNLPRRPRFDQLSHVPPVLGFIADLADVRGDENLDTLTRDFNAILNWVSAGISFNDKVTLAMVSRVMGVDP